MLDTAMGVTGTFVSTCNVHG